MTTGTPTKVYPIPGRFGVGVALVEQELPTKTAAEELVKTGLFALSEKEANEQAFSTPEATPATDENVKPIRPAETAAEPAPKPARAKPEKATETPAPETATAPEPEPASAEPAPETTADGDGAGPKEE